jgi:hypothetical protein
LADVSSVNLLNTLPAGVKGLVWVGQCNGADSRFVETVRPYIGNPKLFGFYLMDEPDPTGKHSASCKAESLRAEADWIRRNAAGAKTFIVLRNMGSAASPSFDQSFAPRNSHIDLFGLAAYPCRTEAKGCDYETINRYVSAADAAGIPRSSMVPIYQAFGDGNWLTDSGGKYLLPSAEQTVQIIARWEQLLPSPVFDYAYSWGRQSADAPLARALDLQTVFLRHNNLASNERKLNR